MSSPSSSTARPSKSSWKSPRRSLAGVVRAVVVAQAVAGILVAVSFLAFFAVYRTQAAAVSDRQERLLDLRDLRGEVVSAETGLRGYLLVGEPEFLAPYRAAFPRIERGFAQLFSESSPADRRRLVQLRATVQEWRRDFAERVLRDWRGPDRASAVALVRSGQGKRRTDRARAVLNELSRSARRDIDRAEASLRGAGILTVLGFVLATLLFAVATRALSRRMSRRVVAPITALASTAESFGSGAYQERATEGGLVELDLMARTFNDMAERVAGTVQELRQLDRMKSTFVSTVSHELRTPLTAIKGYLEALTEGMAGDLNEEQQEFAEIAQENVARLEALMTDLLLLSRLDSGLAEPDRRPVHLLPVLERLVASFRPAAAKREIEVRLDATGDIVVLGEELRLTQAFGNLVSNALKFGPPGSTVDIRLEGRDADAVVEVTDRGIGIPEDELPQLTQRFFRASTAGGVEGTGLGLAITREMVERQEGRLEIESRVGEGSTFRVRLPVYDGAAPPA
jgi:signal transduction histidine kinase